MLLPSLMVWAVTLTGYPDPHALPSIESVSHQQLIDILCGGQFCTAVAYYDPAQRTIFYDQRLNPKQERAAQGFLLHELVHYLQHQQFEFSVSELTCETRVAMEQEAYKVQRYFLREHNENTYQIDLAMHALSVLCQP